MLNMETIIELAQRFGIKWKSPSTGIALSLLAGASLSIFLLTLQAISTETTRWTGVAAAILVFAFWLHTCRIPKNKPNKIGIALALQYETPEERKRIHADLVERISSRLASGESAHEFYVYEIPGHSAPDIVDAQSASEFFKRSKGHLLIWGSLRTRRQGNSSKFCLRLEGAVTHATIQQEHSKALANDLRQAIPHQTVIDFANELSGFESTSIDLCDGAQFVVALAAAVSGDWAFSRRLLEELRRKSGNKPLAMGKQRKKTKREKGHPTTWRALISPRLASVCFAQFHGNHSAWQQNKADLSPLVDAEDALEAFKRASGQSDCSAYWVNKALLDVTLRQDFASAEKLLNRCRASAISDPTWRLSLAFVHAAKGNLTSALELYDAALENLEGHLQGKTLMDVEEYVHWWLETYKGPPTLYLLSAELNAKGKKDWELALSDLDNFTASGELAKHPQLGPRVANLREQALKATASAGAGEISYNASFSGRGVTAVKLASQQPLPS